MLRGLMSDAEWAFFAPFLNENRTQGGRQPLDHRRVLDGVFYVTRTGVPWRDLPPELGNWNSFHRRYRRWTEAGVWDVMLAALSESKASDNTLQMIASTIVRVHKHAAGGRGKLRETVLAVRAAGSRPRFIPERMRKVSVRSVS